MRVLTSGAGIARLTVAYWLRRYGFTPTIVERAPSLLTRGGYYGGWKGLFCSLGSYRIELKPTVGDDYPAVLRQMKANESGVLLLRDYVGSGATREQFIATFATAGKRVVFLHDVEAQR